MLIGSYTNHLQTIYKPYTNIYLYLYLYLYLQSIYLYLSPSLYIYLSIDYIKRARLSSQAKTEVASGTS